MLTILLSCELKDKKVEGVLSLKVQPPSSHPVPGRGLEVAHALPKGEGRLDEEVRIMGN